MIKLYAHSFSPHARKVHFALAELSEPFEFHFVDLQKGQQRTPEYLAINPAGKVPCLVDGDFVLPESGAALWYLANNYGRGKIVPEDKYLCARVDQWLFWQAYDAHPVLIAPFRLRMMAMLSGGTVDEAAFAKAVAACDGPLTFLDNALAGNDFLVGNAFSIADISLCESLFQLQMAGADFSKFANITRWFGGLASRPAFQQSRPKH